MFLFSLTLLHKRFAGGGGGNITGGQQKLQQKAEVKYFHLLITTDLNRLPTSSLPVVTYMGDPGIPSSLSHVPEMKSPRNAIGLGGPMADT